MFNQMVLRFKYHFSGFYQSNSISTKLHLHPFQKKNDFEKTYWSGPMVPQKLWCMSVSTAPALTHWRIPRCSVCIRQYRTIVTWNPATKHNGLMYSFLYPINKCVRSIILCGNHKSWTKQILVPDRDSASISALLKKSDVDSRGVDSNTSGCENLGFWKWSWKIS